MLPETAPVVEAGEHHLVVADSFGLNGPKTLVSPPERIFLPG